MSWDILGSPNKGAGMQAMTFWLIVTTAKPPHSEPLKDLVLTALQRNHVLNATISKLDWPK